MTYLIQLLNLRRNEVPRLALAAAVFFLAQVDDGIVKSVASAVFNIRAGVDKLPLMYTWIAVVFSLSMALLSWLTAKVARQRLLIGLMVFVTAVLSANALILFFEHQFGETLSVHVYSFLFISSELARTLMNFQIWIVAGGICYTSRAKVLFPLLASSAVLGDIAGGFVVRFLGALLDSHLFYALAVLNMVLILFLLRRLLRRYFVVPLDEQGGGEAATVGENLRYFARSPYLLLLFFLSVAVFALYTTIHYGFNVVARLYYPSEAEITEFFGLFFGLTGVATLFVTTFLLQRLLRWIGTGNVYLWVCIVYSLVAAMLLAVFADLVSAPMIAAIFVGNLINYLLLDSVIAPAYQVLIKLVPQRNSDGTRMIMEGGFMLLGGLVGAGITALHAREWLTLSELFIVLLLLGGGMIVCGFFLKRSYTAVLVQAVREQNFDLEDDQAIQALGELIAHSPDFSRSLLLHRDDGVRQLGIEMLHRSPGPAGEQVCLELLGHENPRIRSAALAALYPQPESVVMSMEAVLGCLQDEDGEVCLSAVRCIANQLDRIDDKVLRARISDAMSARMNSSPHASMQAECLMILERLGHDDSATARGMVLATLLASADVEDLMAGIEAAGRAGGTRVGEQLLPFLDYVHPAVRESAVRSLGELGEDQGFVALLRMLNDPDPDVVEATVQALGKIRSPELRQCMVVELERVPLRQWEGLLSALMVQDDEALNNALIASCRQRLVEASRYLIARRVLSEIGGDVALDILLDQLLAETQLVRNGVVRLLGHLGDTGVVGDLVERLSDEDEEARENAVELLENIADRELLVLLLPLLESDGEERQRMAERTAGWNGVDCEQALRYLLDAAGPWTQVAAVWSAILLGRDELCHAAAGELSEQAQQILREIIDNRDGGKMTGEDQPLTTMEKITFLKESPFFAALPLEELYHVALSIEEESVKGNTAVIKEGTMGDKMYIVVKGELEVKKEGGPRLAVLGEKQVFGDMALLDDEPRSASVVAMGDVHLLSLQRSSLERILRRYSSISFNMMRILSRRLREAQAG
jgi:HEAT repeat protein/ATP/ADP translocase